MKPVLIVGEAPGRRSGGLTRQRVSDLAGRPWEEWADWQNLLGENPGRAGRKGDGWNQLAAKAAAAELDFEGRDRVVLLGRRVAGAVIPGGAGFPFFRWTPAAVGIPPMVVIPHTSGIVRNWNDPATVARARDLLSALAA